MNFQHQFSAHCETGVTSALLNSKEIQMSEPMSFGIGSGLFFIYVPFVKIMGNPLVSYRSIPGSIFKKVNKRLKVSYKSERFRGNELKGQKRLDELLDQDIPVGVQANIYWLKYIPENFRFHFNAHNLIVLDKNTGNQTYKVSDPLLEDFSECDERILTKARFSKGPLAPKGFLYYLNGEQPESIDYEKAINKGINETVKRMLYSPAPNIGVRGMRYLAKHISKWGSHLAEDQAIGFLSSVVRMQEEIGTGGAGFRYIYAGFLDEAAQKLDSKILSQSSIQFEEVADSWRSFAALAVKACKNKNLNGFKEVSQSLLDVADKEKEALLFLKKRYL